MLALKKKRKSKYKEWRMDTLRSDDFAQMKLMTKELAKLRKDDKITKKSHTNRATAASNNNTSASTTNKDK